MSPCWNGFIKETFALYDTESGSVYDLRHFTMPGSEPKISRWDYHSTHVNLLYILSTIDSSSSPILVETGDRWRGYMVNKVAKHN